MKFLIASGLLLLSIGGCSTPSEIKWQSHGDRVLGLGSDDAQDPVSGAIVSKKEAVKRDFRGTRYYFVSDETASEFTAHPEEYALPPYGVRREGRAEAR